MQYSTKAYGVKHDNAIQCNVIQLKFDDTLLTIVKRCNLKSGKRKHYEQYVE